MWSFGLHQNFQGGSGPGVTYSEALQGWISKLGEYSKTFFVIAESFDLLANKNPPWAVYPIFMSAT